jgi:hypothetical protein
MSISARSHVLVLGALAAVLLGAGCGAGSTTTSQPAPTVAAPTTNVQTSPPTTSIPSTNGSSSAVLPVNFVVNGDGSLSPQQVAGPANTTIQLTVTSHASHPVTVAFAFTSLTVPPGQHATTRVPGLKAGRYTIAVDGAERGVLVAGAQPGP